MARWRCVFCVLPLVLCEAYAQKSGQTTLAVTVQPECSVTLTSGSGVAGQAAGFRYLVRTSKAGGEGQVTLSLKAADGVSYPPESTLTYSTQVSGPGTAVSVPFH